MLDHLHRVYEPATSAAALSTPPPAARANSPEVQLKSTPVRIGGGFAFTPEVKALSRGGLDEAAALRALATAGAASGAGRYAPPAKTGPRRPSSAPLGGRRATVESARRDSAISGMGGNSARGASQVAAVSTTEGEVEVPEEAQAPPKNHQTTVQVLEPGGPFTPARFKWLEQERAALVEGLRKSHGHPAPVSKASPGYVVGTFVKGRYDAHRFSSDRNARSAFRVYKSRINASDTGGIVTSHNGELSSQTPTLHRRASAPGTIARANKVLPSDAEMDISMDVAHAGAADFPELAKVEVATLSVCGGGMQAALKLQEAQRHGGG